MKKNVASQIIGAQMVSATDGSAFTGSVTVYVTGDGGTQAAGSVGAGACTHEGNGFHTYAPAQAETNYDHVAFTFVGSGAVPATVQIYTAFPQTGDNYARLGAPAGASVSADIAAVKTQTAAIEVDTQDIQGRLPAALVAGRIDASVGAMASNVLTASALATDAVNEIVDQVWDETLSGHAGVGSTGAALSAAGGSGDPWSTALPGAYGVGTAGKIVGDYLDAAISSRMATYVQPTGFLAATFPAGTIANTTNITAGTITTATNVTNAPTVGDFTATMKASIGTAVAASAVASVTGAVGSIATGGITTASFAAGAIDAAAIAADAIGASELAADAATEIANAVLAATVEGTTTVVQSMRLANSALGGKASGLNTTAAVYRDLADSKNRISATVDADGNRSAVTRDLT